MALPPRAWTGAPTASRSYGRRASAVLMPLPLGGCASNVSALTAARAQVLADAIEMAVDLRRTLCEGAATRFGSIE